MDKLKSRKLWVAVIAGAIIPLFKALDIPLEPAEIAGIVGAGVAYVLGQAKVDAVK